MFSKQRIFALCAAIPLASFKINACLRHRQSTGSSCPTVLDSLDSQASAALLRGGKTCVSTSCCQQRVLGYGSNWTKRTVSITELTLALAGRDIRYPCPSPKRFS